MNNIGVERISEFSKKFSVISTHLGYKKFESEKPKILVFKSSGWVITEVINALLANQYNFEILDVTHLDPDKKKLSLDDYLHFHKELIKKLLEFKPDCILTINHAAFDSIGLLSKILEQFKIPFVSWFVDSPIYIFRNAEPQKSSYLYLFSWEKTYVNRLKALNFENVFYLPLAGEKERFEKAELLPDEITHYECDVAFIGNSNKANTTDWFNKEFANKKLSSLIDEVTSFQIKNPDVEMREIISQFDKSEILKKYDDDFWVQFEAFCILKTTEIFREKVVKKLSENFNFKIFGDEGWKNSFNKYYSGKIDYYRELPKVYKAAKIIVNVTSFQMNSAINQRVFDVFLSGGFLVSDYRLDYDSLFGVNEIPTYKNIDEMVKIVDYYLKNDSEREKITTKIRSNITSNHLYTNRIDQMFKTMKKHYHE